MNLSEILRQAVATFRAHKMRTFLTMFGLIWGIASVILLVGLGRGFVVDQKKHMETLGKDLVIVWGGRTSSQVGGRAAGREIHLNVDDAELIRDECYMVKNVSPELRRTIPEVSQYNSCESGRCRDVAVVPGIPLPQSLRRTADHRRRSARRTPGLGPRIKSIQAAVSRTAGHWRDRSGEEYPVFGCRRTRRKEAEFKLQRSG